MQGAGALEKLAILEQRIAQTSERFAHLKNQYQALQDQKNALEGEIERLRGANRELTDRIGNLKESQDRIIGSLHKDEVKRRIDRVIEKLGELQL